MGLGKVTRKSIFLGRRMIRTRFMPIDKPEKSPYGYAEEQIKMLNGIKLHEAGLRVRVCVWPVVDAGYDVDRIRRI